MCVLNWWMLDHARPRPYAGTSTPRTTSVSSLCMVAVAGTRITSSLRICATQCAQVNCLTIITPCCLLRDIGQKNSGEKLEVNYICTCTEMFSVRVSVRFTVHLVFRIRIQLFRGYRGNSCHARKSIQWVAKVKCNNFTIKWYLSVLGWSGMLQIW
jgi:hypothetical protein